METFFEQGFQADIKSDYKRAITLYKQSIENEELNLKAYLNLIGILMEISLDFGVSSNLTQRKIYSQEELDDLYRYLENLLKQAEVLFDSSEVIFWKSYKEHYYKGLSRDKMIDIIKINDNNLIPYFQLYLDDLSNDSDTIYYSQKIKDLKRHLREEPTIKNKYILSLIESAERQKRFDHQ